MLKQYPAWFASGQVIYQATTGDVGGFDIYVTQPEGSSVPTMRLTKAAGDEMMPALHGPSGKVVFVSDRKTLATRSCSVCN